MKGKILFCSYDESFKKDLSEYEIKLQIVRFTNKGIRNNFKHVPDLAPSLKLFEKTMYKWKKFIFTKSEKEFMRSGKTQTWFDLYEKEFYFEKENDKKFQIAYNRLKYYLDKGINIIAMCYCEDFNKCHRKLLAYKLEKEGYTVILE